jgi:type III restriction enzyme
VELRFDDQPYQLAAVDAVVGVFHGQPRVDAASALLFSEEGVAAVANHLSLSEDQLLANLQSVQRGNRLAPDAELRWIRGTIATETGPVAGAFANFSVEMETGTGKTYAYIRTSLELARRYGFRKFIIVVPSVAIREGVLKTFRITERHFAALFPEVVYRYRVYRSDRLADVRSYAQSGDVEFLIITIDSFNRDSNVMRQRPDAMGSVAPIHVVQATRPILILDEPQNMESQLSVSALSDLHPIAALRYSATHRDPYNIVYRLTPYDAYRLRLVKQIAVASVLTEHDANRPYVRVVETRANASKVTAKLALHVLTPDGTVKERKCTVRVGDRLASSANRPIYAGLEVQRIDVARDVVSFTNGLEIRRGEAAGEDKHAIFDAQIVRALEEHFRKQETLGPRGVKVLTLFFVDRVDNYANDGVIRRIFDRRFNELKVLDERWRDAEPGAVQAAYFAQKRRRGGRIELVDSNERPKEEDETAFNLIMRDKERLLSFDEPVAFLFSHSALREGWDNPNVFQIVTLNQSISDVRKRQEIGRGLRLAVDQSGARVHEPEVNTLTVVANESYRDYVAQLQQQLDADGEHPTERAPLPRDANQDRSVRVREEVVLSEEFQRLWERISRRTRYEVSVNPDTIVSQVVPRLKAIDFRRARITITTAALEVQSDNSVAPSVTDVAVRGLPTPPPIPNLLELIAHQLEHTTPRMRLTRRTIFRVVAGCGTDALRAALDNPQEFALEAARVIKDILADELVDGIKYVQTGDAYKQELVNPSTDGDLGELVPVKHSVVDRVSVESQTERRFVEALDTRRDVPLFVKLPRRFVVPTPVGNYNPDWALVMERGEGLGANDQPVLFMVRETKSTSDPNQLRANEARKIRCGEAHFQRALGVDFAAVTSADEIV